MNALPTTTSAKQLLVLLRRVPQGGLDLDTIDELKALVRRLGHADPRWVDAREAQHLLGVSSEATVAELARAGLLRNRSLPDGALNVRLVDVLHERVVREGLLAFGGDEPTGELTPTPDVAPLVDDPL